MRFVILIVLVTSLLSCTGNKAQTKKLPEQKMETNVLMKSPSGIILTVADVENTIAAAPGDAKHSILGNGEMFMKFTKTQYLSKHFVDYAMQHQLDQDPLIKAKLINYKNRLLTNAAVDHYIDQQEKPDFSDLAHEHYLIDQSSYTVPEQILISHILIRTGEKHTDAEAKKIAEEVHEKAKRGDDFKALASEFSEDSSSAVGGDLGWVKKGQMIKPFEKVAFALQEPGDVGSLVKTKYGYHVIKLFEKKAARQQSFEEVKPLILRDLESEHAKELQSQMVLKYDVSDDTEINTDTISALYVRLKRALNKK
jgi:peptidyl-prolyl cis-trans isomerase C